VGARWPWLRGSSASNERGIMRRKVRNGGGMRNVRVDS
jgi:hypothetical protein